MIQSSSNWAGNYTYRAANLHKPESIERIQELVSRSNKVKALGTRHSFNDIADSPGDLISLEHFDHVLELDREQHAVTVEAGIRYGQLCHWLHHQGFALHNLASLPHISVAGACATATHGSGGKYGNLATAVSELELITADGELIRFSRHSNPEEFQGAVVALGGLGIVTKLTLEIQPTFDMRQDIFENLPLSQLEDHFDELVSRAYSVSLFTDWRDEVFNQVWLKRRLPVDVSFALEPELFGAKPATRPLHPIASLSAEHCTEQLGVAGPWHERLPHFRMDFIPSSGEELQAEYFVPYQQAHAALRAIAQIREHIAPLLHTSEVRMIAADDLWMSPCYQQDCVSIHFTWKKDWPGVSQVLPLIEERLAPFGARPHWGKLFTMPAKQVQSLYVRLTEFRALLQKYDPQGKFRNAFLDKYIFGSGE